MTGRDYEYVLAGRPRRANRIELHGARRFWQMAAGRTVSGAGPKAGASPGLSTLGRVRRSRQMAAVRSLSENSSDTGRPANIRVQFGRISPQMAA